jgi:transmembrane sensor
MSVQKIKRLIRSEIVARLEDWYGVNFITIGVLETDFHYSGKYNNETLEEVLYGISFVHHFEFKISGDTVKIYSNHKM